MAVTRLVPSRPSTRADQVDKMVREALAKHRALLDSDIDLRTIIIDVKLTRDGHSVRAVVISYSSEIQNPAHAS